MLDPKWLREAPDAVIAMLAARGADPALYTRWCELDGSLRAAITAAEALQAQRNAVSKEVGARKKAGQDAADLVAQAAALGQEQAAKEALRRELEEKRDAVALELPNRLLPATPPGKTAADNGEVRRHGTPRIFDFDPLPHWDLGVKLGIFDQDRAAQMAGARFAVLAGPGARLHRALANFMLDLHTREHGFTELAPPLLVNRAAMTGTGQLPKFAADLFRTADPELYLIPTAEVPLANYHAGEILPAAQLPRRYAALTPCFRAEAGAAGKDTRGLIRQHQFDKVEMVSIVRAEDSAAELEKITAAAEKVLQLLELPYRVMALCGGDIGFAAAQTYDLEVWLPSQKTYREISSCSNCLDFQARRLNLRYREDKLKPQFCHTLNGSGLAVGRTWIAVLENCQQHDGSIAVPPALQPYLGGLAVITG